MNDPCKTRNKTPVQRVRCFSALSSGLTPPTPPPPMKNARRAAAAGHNTTQRRGDVDGGIVNGFFRAPLNTEESRCTDRRDAGVTRGRCQNFLFPHFQCRVFYCRATSASPQHSTLHLYEPPETHYECEIVHSMCIC